MAPIGRKKPATYADLEALPENMTGEIIDGELFAWPRPSGPHGVATSVLGSDINGAFHRAGGGGPGRPGGWWILDEPELHMHGDVLVPDVAGWRRERMPSVPKNHKFEVPPDWVCEVLSPSTQDVDRSKKRRIYGRERVEHLWLVEPLAPTIEVHRLLPSGRSEIVNTLGRDVPERVRIEPFEAVELEVRRWFETE